jgi:hypothetical protein
MLEGAADLGIAAGQDAYLMRRLFNGQQYPAVNAPLTCII